MSDADAAPAVPKSSQKYPVTGKTLGMKAVVAEAMIETGAKYREIQEATGISHATIAALKKQRVSDGAQVDKVKRSLRDRCVMKADALLKSMSRSKMREADLGTIARAAGIMLDRAGIGPVSHHEIFKSSVNRYVKG